MYSYRYIQGFSFYLTFCYRRNSTWFFFDYEKIKENTTHGLRESIEKNSFS